MKTEIANAVVAAFTKLLNGFGFDVKIQITENPALANKQAIAESMTDIAKSAAAVLMSAGIQMGNVSK